MSKFNGISNVIEQVRILISFIICSKILQPLQIIWMLHSVWNQTDICIDYKMLLSGM